MTVTTAAISRRLRLREIADNLGLGQGQGQIAGSRSTSERGENPPKVKQRQSFCWHRLVLLNACFRDATSTVQCDCEWTDVEGTNKFGQRKQIANPTDSHLFCAEGGEG